MVGSKDIAMQIGGPQMIELDSVSVVKLLGGWCATNKATMFS